MVSAKRLLCIAVCITALLICACGEDAGEKDIALNGTVKAAVAAYNGQSAVSFAYAFDMKEHGADKSLMFTQGTVSYRNEDKLSLSGRVTQVSYGEGTTFDVYYKAGAYYWDSGSGKFYLGMDKSEMLNAFFCVPAAMPEEGELCGFRCAQTGGGTKYVYSANTTTALYLFETNMYGYCGLRKPVREKTEFSETEYSYIVDENGALKGFKVSTQVTLYDTAPYYPSYSVPESDLKHSFDISLEITVKAVGDGVTVEVPNTSEYVFLG